MRFCGTCGEARGSDQARFCSSCGTPFQADGSEGVPTAPAGAAPQPVRPPVSQPPPTPFRPAPVAPPATGAGYSGPGADHSELDVAMPVGRSTTGRRKPVGLIAAGAVAAVALVGGGLVGYQVLSGGGGADTPDAAVRDFLTSAAKQDPVGSLDMVVPGEVVGLDDLYDAAHDRLEKSDLAGGGSAITDAVQVELSDLDFRVDEIGEHTARVVLTGGSYAVTLDPDKLPDRLAFAASSFPDDRSYSGDIIEDVGYGLPDADGEDDRPEPYLLTTEVDGRWYVSAVGTFLDAAFGGGGLDEDDLLEEGIRPPDFSADQDRDPVVSDSPEDVLPDLVAAANASDLQEVLDRLPGDETVGLQPYVETFSDALTQEGTDFDLSLDDADYETDEQGDLVKLTVRSGSGSIGADFGDGETFLATGNVSGRCATGSTTETYGDDYDDYDDYDDSYTDEGGFCLDGEIVNDTGVDSYFVMLRKVDDGYQLDPIATAVEYGRTVVEKAPDSTIDDIVDAVCQDVAYDDPACS